MKAFEQRLQERNKTGGLSKTPVFYRPGYADEDKEISGLLAQKPFIQLHDTIHDQLRELIKTLNPSQKFSEAELEEEVKIHLNGCPEWAYGVWVYYPWNERLVHIVDKEEFIILRTNRNKYKITDEERDILATKKIGVIGLSVGQSVALTLAMERGFGELRIADFDTLELTNLNRLRAGIHQLGLKKTLLVAREIAEIDPFLKVTCFSEGITEENIEAFLLENGKLDVLIDECDGIDIKILCRIKAKKNHIPVLMEASDRATIDVERFDLEPERSILHGFIDHLDISKVKDLKTSEEKVPYILPIAGIETLSSRMKASAIEVGETISTWPQLASAVNLGGGITADVCRRVLLDQFHLSGRYFIDIEELIGDKKEQRIIPQKKSSELTSEMMESIVSQTQFSDQSKQIKPDKQIIEEIVKAAIAAPSAGNNQPWKWYFDGFNLWLFHDLKRSYSFGDPYHIAAYVALGAAIENAILKAKSLGINAVADLFPLLKNNTNPVALIRILERDEKRIEKDNLVDHIYERHTNRSVGTGKTIPVEIFNEIRSTVEKIPGAQFLYTDKKDEIKALSHILGIAERLRMFIPEGHHDLFEREIRWTPEEAKNTGDGIDLATFEITPTEYIGLRLAKSFETIELLNYWNVGRAMEKLTRKGALTASAIGLMTVPGFTAKDFILGGRAVERMWLTANKNNIAVQPMLASVLHFAMLNEGKGENLPDKIRREFADLYKIYLEIWGQKRKHQTDVFLFRLFYAKIPETKSYRLPIKDVYTEK